MTTVVQPKPTLDQQRATDALAKIRKLQDRGDSYYGHYVSYVSALPATIVMSGLGQGLASELAKTKGASKPETKTFPHRLLYDHVASWLSKQVSELNGPPDRLIHRLIQADQDVYVRAQAEAMAYLSWLKQFARAYLKEREGQGD